MARKLTILTLMYLQERLAALRLEADVVICVESDTSFERKFKEDREEEVLCFNPVNGRIERVDGKGLSLGVTMRDGSCVPDIRFDGRALDFNDPAARAKAGL